MNSLEVVLVHSSQHYVWQKKVTRGEEKKRQVKRKEKKFSF